MLQFDGKCIRVLIVLGYADTSLKLFNSYFANYENKMPIYNNKTELVQLGFEIYD